MFEIILGVVLLMYVGLWIADLIFAEPEARKKIMMDLVETTTVAMLFGTFLWWLL